jgi:soluble lytic murein transglycosylase-like protein
VTRRASRETRFQPIIQAASARYGVDPDLIRAVIHVESAYDPEAVSSKGAAGLMQLMPATADELGVADLFDPEHNIHGGAKYLKQLIRLFGGDRTLALAAYHAGITRVRKFRGIPPYKATHRYIQDVLTHYRAYKASRGEGGKSTV